MIRKSGYRLSEKIMRKLYVSPPADNADGACRANGLNVRRASRFHDFAGRASCCAMMAPTSYFRDRN
jgi:hypothetical protein